MNDLNSILIEGEVVSDIKPIEAESEGGCEFTVMSLRNGKSGHETTFFAVRAEGRLAEVSMELLSQGSSVRVVGRVRQERTPVMVKFYVYAEHVEIKPKRRK